MHATGVKGVIAIVGRPNVGKSALFNRIVGRRIAIVHDMPGVTRDRISAEAEWKGRKFTLLDTGGIGLLRGERAENTIQAAAFEQVEIALESAQAIILVVNVREGVVALDVEVAARLRKSGKPVLVAVNKCDDHNLEMGTSEFARLGFPNLYPVSAIHDRGIDRILADAFRFLPDAPEEAPKDPDAPATPEPRGEKPLKVAIIGRPNVGKSSMINAITGSDRVIVSPVPGTTRDAVDVPFEIESEGIRENYILIDTAGMRKGRRVQDAVELFSIQRTEESIQRCDVVVFMIDAETGIVEQDKKIADSIVENRKACIVVVNKWDLVAEEVRKARLNEVERRNKSKNRQATKQLSTLGEFAEWVQETLFFLDYAPVIFTSATQGFQLDRLLEAVRYVAAELKKEIPTSLLNRTLHDAVEYRQPVSSQGMRLKFFYATQVSTSPPSILLFVNKEELFTPVYKKYLADSMRKAFGFEGCPIIINPRSRPKTIEPKMRRLVKPKRGLPQKSDRPGRRARR